MTDVPVWPRVRFIEDVVDKRTKATAVETSHNGRVFRNAVKSRGMKARVLLMDWARKAVSS